MLKFNLNSKIKKSNILNLAIILVLLLILVAVYNRKSSSGIGKNELNKFMVDKMTECQNQGVDSCYKNIAHIFATEFEIKDVLQVFEENEKTPVFFSKCHTTLHYLGQEEYKIIKDTSRALSLGTPICFAGFYHGVLEAYLIESGLINDNEKLAKELPSLCGGEDNFALKKSYNECLHGLGHALMFATNGELPGSLKLCDNLPSSSDQNWCYSGSFMENSTSSTNRDHPSKYLKSDDPMYPCNILEAKYLNMCYTLQGFYFAEKSNYNWKQNEKLCKQEPSEFQSGCFNAMGQTQVGFTQDLNAMRDNCYLISDKQNRGDCLYGIIGGLGERYNDGWFKVLTFCNTILTGDEKNNCYKRAIESRRGWINDPDTLESFCTQIDSDIFKSQCRNAT